MSLKNNMWIEKYRPSTIDGYIFHDDSHKQAFLQMIVDQDIPHLLLSGVQGTGKTTIAKILVNSLEIDDTDVLTINASDENSVDVIREKIKGFISTFALGKFKVVFLEEADYITPNGQAVLRNMMEQYANTARFILTCNYEHKVIPSIQSRCQHFRFKAGDKDSITEQMAIMLASENIVCDIETLDAYVRVGYPDVRKIINLLQQNSKTGTLIKPTTVEAGDYKFKLLDLLTADDWNGARKLCCGTVAAEEWEDVYRFLYDNLHMSTKFESQSLWEAGIVVIAEHLYKHSLVADPEINAASMFIQLSTI